MKWDVCAARLIKKFDAVIVGHRFPAEEKYVLAVEAKEKSNTPVLLVCGGLHGTPKFPRRAEDTR